MDPQIARLQKTSDFFALLGLPVSFALDSQQIDDAASAVQATLDAAATTADAATQSVIGGLRGHVAEGALVLRDPIKRGEYLLNFYGSGNDPNSVPPGFRDELSTLQRAMTAAIAANDDEMLILVRQQLLDSRQTQLTRIAQIFAFPRNVPNPVSQRGRDEGCRAGLNAIHMLDKLLTEI